MYKGPSITASKLLAAVIEEGVLDEAEKTSLLGAERHDVSLNTLEIALTRENLVTNARLAEIKGAVAGLRVVTDTGIGAKPAIDANLSRATGAVILDVSPLTVAMVEDIPAHVERLSHALGATGFDIWLCTVSQFAELHKSCYSGARLESRPAVSDIYEVLDEGVSRRASDIHLSIGQPPVLRVDGRLVALPRQPLDSIWMHREMVRLAGAAKVEQALKEYNADLAYSYGASRFRLNLGADRHGLTLSARKLPTKIPTLDDLNLPRSIRAFSELDRGLVLVTGPTGSGKSTTLASVLNSVALNQSRHIITLEDPIEFHLSQGRSMVNQRELHDSFASFPEGLRQALRQDPDVILVGEMRDLDTIRTAVTAAETGHLVFGTLHTFDAPSTVGRIVSSFSEGEQEQIRSQLSYVLKGIVSQTLVPSASGRGRLAAFEVMVTTPAVANNLRKVEGHTVLRQTIETGVKDGMQTMDMALAALVRRGLVLEADAEEKARDVESFRARVHRHDDNIG